MTAEATQEPKQFISIQRICGEIYDVSRSHIWREVRAGRFPQPVIQEGRITRWDYAEVMAWRAEQFRKRDERLTKARAESTAKAEAATSAVATA